MQFRWENFNAFNGVNMNDTIAGGVIPDVIVPCGRCSLAYAILVMSRWVARAVRF